MDYSTLNLKVLKMLPVFTVPPAYTISRSMGSGCAGDPPGYPTYFLRHVYTRHGNTPREGPLQVIFDPEGLPRIVDHNKWYQSCKGWQEKQGRFEKLLRRLWQPLPLEHERTILWMADAYRHLRHCYADDTKTYGRDGMIIYPVPYYELKHFHDDPRFSEEWRTKEKESAEQTNRELTEAYERIAIPDNHRAARLIRKFYPEHEPNLEWIDNPPQRIEQWWETEAKRPGTIGDCDRQLQEKYNNPNSWHHPINGSWCQWCGWRQDEHSARP